MKKKFSTDFMYKDSYLWIIPDTKSLHWYRICVIYKFHNNYPANFKGGSLLQIS